MRRRVIADLARGLAALGTLMVLVAGVPSVLVLLVGWPLPRTLPNLDQLTRAMSANSLSDTALINILAIGCWLAWIATVLCVATEMISWFKGQAARRLPLAGFLQPAVRQLVVTAALLVGPLRSPLP